MNRWGRADRIAITIPPHALSIGEAEGVIADRGQAPSEWPPSDLAKVLGAFRTDLTPECLDAGCVQLHDSTHSFRPKPIGRSAAQGRPDPHKEVGTELSDRSARWNWSNTEPRI